MDRISALRNIEEALRAFENGEIDLATAEEQACAALRTYATDFGDEADAKAVYRAADGTTVVATSKADARELISRLTGSEPGEIEHLG